MLNRSSRSRAIALVAFIGVALSVAVAYFARGGGPAATPEIAARSGSAPESSAALATPGAGDSPSARASVFEPALDGGTAPGAEELDATDLVVDLFDAQGARVPRGRLECFASDGEAPEVDEQAEVQRLEFSEGRAVLRLSSRLAEAFLIAHGVDGASGSSRVPRLRGAGPTYRAGGRVEHRLRLELRLESPTPRLWGAIKVDGEVRTPRGLRVQLLHAPLANAASIEAVRAREPKAARVDSLNSTYFVAPLTPHAIGLWVRSEECAPLWVALPGERLSGDLRQDLECSTGVVLEVRCLDALSGAPAPGARLHSEVLVTVASEPRRTTQRSLFDEHVADARGVVRIAGLPRAGRVRLREKALAAGRALLSTDDVLLELELTAQLEDIVRREVRVGAPPTAPVRIWGWSEELTRLARCALDGPERVRVRIAALGDEVHASRAFEAELQPPQWSVSAPLTGAARAWIECGGVRVSEHLELDLSNATEIGPVSFAARAANAWTLRWVDGLAGSRLELRAASRSGLEDVAAWVLEHSSGERGVQLARSVEVLDASLELPGGARRRWLTSTASHSASTLVMDLGASRARSIRIPSLSEPQWGTFGLELLAVAGPAETARVRVELPCRAGEALEPVPLEPGEYAFRLAGSHNAVVCGFVRVDASSNAPLELPFDGTRRWLGERDSQQGCEIVVESVAGQLRSAAGVEALFRFVLAPSEQAPLVPSEFTYRRHTP